MIGVTTAVILDTRKSRNDGTYPAKMRLTYMRQQKYYPLGKSLSEDDWEKVQSQKPRKEHKELRLFFDSLENKAVKLIEKMDRFSFSSFERLFNQKPKQDSDVFTYYQTYIDKLIKEERIGTADNYDWAQKSFKKYIKYKSSKRLNFDDINPEWLEGYEKWILSSGKSITTVGIYARTLRSIINIAIEDGSFSRELYPFGRRKYIIPSAKNIKKALKLAQIKQIVLYKPVTQAEERARDLWLFSYLCNGANVKDISKLKYHNITESSIIFIRAKTERTNKRSLKPVVVPILAQTKKIIDKWGIKPISPKTYIFGILCDGLSKEEERKKVNQATQTINNYMKKIGKKLAFDLALTTYVARHSFATVLKRSGSSTEYISESLGHSDIKTTANYLDSFEQDTMLENQKKLVAFD